MAEIIAQGTAWNFSTIPNYEDKFGEGERGIIKIGLKSPLPDAVVNGIDSALRQAGVTLTEKVKQTSSSPATLRIRFRKTMPWLAIIIGVIVAGIVIWVLVTSWQLLKEVGIEPAKVMPFILLGIIAVVGFIVLTKGKIPGIGG